LKSLKNRTGKHDAEIKLIFDYIKKLIEHPKEKTQRIGFKKDW